MNHVVSLIISEGIPLSVFIGACNVSGLKGGAKITKALSAIGPGGMMEGLITLSMIRIITFILSELTIDQIYIGVVEQLCEDKQLSYDDLIIKIQKLPISNGLKLKLMNHVDDYYDSDEC